MDLSALQETTSNFVSELERSAKGEKTSLAFIKNTIPSSPLVKEGETFQVMVIGGTVYVSALMKKTADSVEIISIKETTLPFFYTKDIFLDFVEKNLSDVSLLTINFGYPIKPLFHEGKLEGILLFGSKESTFTSLLNENVAEEIEKYILQKQNRNIKVTLANDTICLLLSGLIEQQDEYLAAGIIGTGINFACFLDNVTPVNLEAGGFDKFPQSPTGKEIDDASNMQKYHIFEKEISGGYLYKHFNLILEEKKINYPPLIETAQLSDISENEKNEEIRLLAQNLLLQSAQFTACAIAGITNFKQHDMTFVMQGSVFWKGYKYKETVEKILKELAPQYKVKFLKVEHADLLGAAKLVA